MKFGNELLETIKDHDRRSCPLCAKDVGRTALVDCVYASEPCDCKAAPYKHLVETVYHRECLLAPRAGLRTIPEQS